MVYFKNMLWITFPILKDERETNCINAKLYFTKSLYIYIYIYIYILKNIYIFLC